MVCSEPIYRRFRTTFEINIILEHPPRWLNYERDFPKNIKFLYFSTPHEQDVFSQGTTIFIQMYHTWNKYNVY